MLARIVVASLFLLLSTAARSATPMDKCSDILTDGTMAKTSYKSNDFLQQIIHARFFKQSYQQAAKDQSFGVSIPIEGILVGAEWSEKNYNEYQEAVRRTLNMNTIEQHQLEIAVSSGDPTIAAKWAECMKKGEGALYVWFTANNATTATVSVFWNGGSFNPKQVEIESIQSEPARQWTSKNTNKCLYPKKKLRSGDTCQFTVTLPKSTDDLVLTVNGKSESAPASAAAYLAPRLVWVSRSILLDSRTETSPNLQYSTASSERSVETGSPTCFDAKKIGKGIPLGSTFLPDTVHGSCWGNGYCVTKSAITLDKVCWQAEVHPDGRHASCGCYSYGKITVLLAGWYPVDSPDALGKGAAVAGLASAKASAGQVSAKMQSGQLASKLIAERYALQQRGAAYIK